MDMVFMISVAMLIAHCSCMPTKTKHESRSTQKTEVPSSLPRSITAKGEPAFPKTQYPNGNLPIISFGSYDDITASAFPPLSPSSFLFWLLTLGLG
jgi:hypothetical protein